METKIPVKLHLGCFQKKIHGYINVDIRSDVKPDVIDDVFTLKKFKNNSIDVIYCCHVLEHASDKEAEQALKRWFELLKKGGTLRLSVPDMQAVCEHYIYHKDFTTLKSFIYGSQKHPFDFHRTGWDEESLTKQLNNIGFVSVKKYDWRNTDHFYIDDYSQCYLPSISYKSRRINDTINGKQMSLNIEAKK